MVEDLHINRDNRDESPGDVDFLTSAEANLIKDAFDSSGEIVNYGVGKADYDQGGKMGDSMDVFNANNRSVNKSNFSSLRGEKIDPLKHDENKPIPIQCVAAEEINENPDIFYKEDSRPLLHPNDQTKILPAISLFRASIINVFWIILSGLPSVVVVCLIGYGYSRLPWTRDLKYMDRNDTAVNSYFNRTVMFWFDDVVRTFLIALLNVFVACVLYNFGARHTLRSIAFVTLPITLVGAISFYAVDRLITDNKFAIWFYYIDIVIFMNAFFLVVAVINVCSAKYTETTVKQITLRCVLPMYTMALGTAFVDIYFSKTYRVEKDGLLLKYVQRLVVYPIFMDSFLGLGEFCVRRLHGTSVHGAAHSLYFIQVRFGILGRYMNLTAGDITMLTITCCLVMVKDVVFHRMGRVQCWLFYKVRRFLTRDVSSTREFRSWYFEERFRDFRACVLTNDLRHEFIATVVIPALFVFFRPHRLLFRFDDDLVVNKDGQFQSTLFSLQLVIQLVFLLLTYIAVITIESRFNGVDVGKSLSHRSILQEVSQVVIFVWGMLQILSAARVVPNYFQCNSVDICTCRFNINKTYYGCF